MNNNDCRADSRFNSTYNKDNTTSYLKTMFASKGDSRNLWNEIITDRNDKMQYSLLSYTTDQGCDYTVQFQNNMMVPVYKHMSLGFHLYNFKLLEKLDEPAVIFIESFTISDAVHLKEIGEYYANTPLFISDKVEENIEANKDILTLLARESFPVTIRALHVIKIADYKHERRIYIPSLNVTLYKAGKDLKYAGNHPLANKCTKEFNILPKSSREDRNLYQYYFKIINNEEPGRKYYTKLFNKIVEIESTPSMSGTENSCVKLAYYQEKREIETIIKEGVTEEHLKEFGIYSSRAAAELAFDKTKELERMKQEIELNKLNLQHTDLLFRSASLKHNSITLNKKQDLEYKKLDLDNRKLDLDYDKLELDKTKLILEQERLELEFSKLWKEIKLMERGYRNEIGKLNINLIKEITDSVGIVIKLANLVKSFINKE